MKSSREMYTALEVSKSKEKFGDNYAACKLPQFTGADGNTYQLSGFCGNKLLGVKPQTEMGKAIVCLNLAEYLSSSECQLDRLEQLGWLPSNLQLQQNSVIAEPAYIALLEQNNFAVSQEQYPSDYWKRAKCLGDDIISGVLNTTSSDDYIKMVLYQFEADCKSYVDDDLYYWY